MASADSTDQEDSAVPSTGGKQKFFVSDSWHAREVTSYDVTAIREVYRIANDMLSEMSIIKPVDRAAINRRLANGVAERVYLRMSMSGLTAAGQFAYFGGLLITPVLLLIVSVSKHSPVIDTLLYFASILLSFLFMIIIVVISMITFEDIFYSGRDIFWAWSESRDPDRRQTELIRRRRSIYKLVPIVVFILAVATGSVYLLRFPRPTYVELVCISILTPVLAAIITLIVEISARISRPSVARLADSLYPGDAIIVDLINLAFFTKQNRTHWQDGEVIWRLLLECERTARIAEYNFPGLCRRTLTGDMETMTWAREQSAQLATGIRRYKRALLLVSGAETLDVIYESLCSSLVSACKGNWLELIINPEAPSKQSRLRRWVRLAIPTIFLAAAAVFIPLLVHTPELRSTIRLYFIVAAVLSAVTAISPETLKGAETIQGIVERISGKARH